jgi:hypothetical protein
MKAVGSLDIPGLIYCKWMNFHLGNSFLVPASSFIEMEQQCKYLITSKTFFCYDRKYWREKCSLSKSKFCFQYENLDMKCEKDRIFNGFKSLIQLKIIYLTGG